MRVAEFFAGIGLVRLAPEAEGAQIVWANDIDPVKQKMYVDNFGANGFVLGDVADVQGSDIPDIDLATASFPCTDLSLAGNRAGLKGRESGTLWEFTRILSEMEQRRPSLVLVENVPGLITSNGGTDLANLIARLNDLGYVCNVFVADAKWFVPQSRERVFVIGFLYSELKRPEWTLSPLRPERLLKFLRQNSHLNFYSQAMPVPANGAAGKIGAVRTNLWYTFLRTRRAQSGRGTFVPCECHSFVPKMGSGRETEQWRDSRQM